LLFGKNIHLFSFQLSLLANWFMGFLILLFFATECSKRKTRRSVFHSFLDGGNEFVSPSLESWELLASLFPITGIVSEWTVWVLDGYRDKTANPEVGNAHFWSAQPWASLAEWLNESEEFVESFPEFGSSLTNCRGIETFSETCVSQESEDVVIGVDNHVALLSTQWVIGVVTMLETKIADHCSSATSL
jgi:hypothetical protein